MRSGARGRYGPGRGSFRGLPFGGVAQVPLVASAAAVGMQGGDRVALVLVAAMAAAAALLDTIQVIESTALGCKTDLAFPASVRGGPRHHPPPPWAQAGTDGKRA